MFCTHCGFDLDTIRVENTSSSYHLAEGYVDDSTKVEYICPRCGRLIHEDINEEEKKALARASHAEIQRGNNSFATGMSFVCIGIIVLVISIIFYKLSMKAANNFVLSTTCIEFYVFIVTVIVGSISFIVGALLVTLGLLKRFKYEHILHDIQNETFVQ